MKFYDHYEYGIKIISINNRELMTHENVTFNSNGTLSTIPNHPLLWRGDLSEGRQEDDIFYLPNIALLVSNRRL